MSKVEIARKPAAAQEPTSFFLFKEEFNCESDASRHLQAQGYSASGSATYGISEVGKWEGIIPDSNYAKLERLICTPGALAVDTVYTADALTALPKLREAAAAK